jgi:hypothetical protein
LSAWIAPKKARNSCLDPKDIRKRGGLSQRPEGRGVDSTVDAVCPFSLGCTMLFPASLIPNREIIVGVRQQLRISSLPQLDGDAVRLDDFIYRLVVAELSSPLVCCFGSAKQSAMPYSAGCRNRPPAMPVKL